MPKRSEPRPGSAKADLYREHASEYVAPKQPAMIDVGPAVYLAIDGAGEPGGAAFVEGVGALYNVAFTVKMARKFAGTDYTVTKLEGRWWSDASPDDFLAAPQSAWQWELMIRLPEFVTGREISGAIDKLRARGKPRAVARVERRELEEGACVQMLHAGPYSDEARTIDAMRRFAAEHGLSFSGRHHEIYLSDPRRVAPEKLKTILRQPVRRASLR